MSHLENGFMRVVEAIFRAGDALPVREHVFHTTRKWRFDFAWVAERLAVEIEGGMFKGGGHQRGRAYQKNCEKYNAATVMGWRVLRYTNLDLEERPVQCVEQARDLLKKLQAGVPLHEIEKKLEARDQLRSVEKD